MQKLTLRCAAVEIETLPQSPTDVFIRITEYDSLDEEFGTEAKSWAFVGSIRPKLEEELEQ